MLRQCACRGQGMSTFLGHAWKAVRSLHVRPSRRGFQIASGRREVDRDKSVHALLIVSGPPDLSGHKETPTLTGRCETDIKPPAAMRGNPYLRC